MAVVVGDTAEVEELVGEISNPISFSNFTRQSFCSRCPATVECSAHSDEAAWDCTRHIQKEPQDPSF